MYRTLKHLMHVRHVLCVPIHLPMWVCTHKHFHMRAHLQTLVHSILLPSTNGNAYRTHKHLETQPIYFCTPAKSSAYPWHTHTLWCVCVTIHNSECKCALPASKCVPTILFCKSVFAHSALAMYACKHNLCTRTGVHIHKHLRMCVHTHKHLHTC